MHVNIRSLLPKFVLFTALAHPANLDVPAVSESWLRKTKEKLKCPSLTIIFSDNIELPKGVELACRVLSYYSRLCPNNLSFNY
jgi:hypothetical protein